MQYPQIVYFKKMHFCAFMGEEMHTSIIILNYNIFTRTINNNRNNNRIINCYQINTLTRSFISFSHKLHCKNIIRYII